MGNRGQTEYYTVFLPNHGRDHAPICSACHEDCPRISIMSRLSSVLSPLFKIKRLLPPFLDPFRGKNRGPTEQVRATLASTGLAHGYGEHEQPGFDNEVDDRVADNDRHQAPSTDQVHHRTKRSEDRRANHGPPDHLESKHSRGDTPSGMYQPVKDRRDGDLGCLSKTCRAKFRHEKPSEEDLFHESGGNPRRERIVDMEQASLGEILVTAQRECEVKPNEESGHGRCRKPTECRRGSPHPELAQPYASTPEIQEQQNQDHDL